MSYNVLYTNKFKKQAKKLKKKYPSFKNDIIEFENIVKNNYKKGTILQDNIYKIRIKIESKNKGKSGGARIIYYVITNKKKIIALAIYDKSQKDSISKSEIIELLKDLA